jgi:5-methyltetrahydropteroyltriglutamate--homocysteine methyltransferase
MTANATTQATTGARAKPPFRGDHVGSFLRPKFLLDAREQFRGGAIGADALRKVEDEAIRGIVTFGVRVVTDFRYSKSARWIAFA